MDNGYVRVLVLLLRPAFFLPGILLLLFKMGGAIDAKEGDEAVVFFGIMEVKVYADAR